MYLRYSVRHMKHPEEESASSGDSSAEHGLFSMDSTSERPSETVPNKRRKTEKKPTQHKDDSSDEYDFAQDSRRLI